MFKVTPLLLCLFWAAAPVFGQNAWQLNLPASVISNTFCGLAFDGTHYTVHAHANVTQLDQLGAITGHLRLQNNPQFWTSVLKKRRCRTGTPIF